MIGITCPNCGVEREIPENKMADLRCNSSRCTSTTVIFKQNTERLPLQEEVWQKVKAGDEVNIGYRVGTLNQFLWAFRRTAVIVPVEPVPELVYKVEETKKPQRKIFKRDKT